MMRAIANSVVRAPVFKMSTLKGLHKQSDREVFGILFQWLNLESRSVEAPINCQDSRRESLPHERPMDSEGCSELHAIGEVFVVQELEQGLFVI